MKQAIPPLNPRSTSIGAGEVYNVMRDTDHNVIARNDGVVVGTNSKNIVVYEPRD